MDSITRTRENAKNCAAKKLYSAPMQLLVTVQVGSDIYTLNTKSDEDSRVVAERFCHYNKLRGSIAEPLARHIQERIRKARDQCRSFENSSSERNQMERNKKLSCDDSNLKKVKSARNEEMRTSQNCVAKNAPSKNFLHKFERIKTQNKPISFSGLYQNHEKNSPQVSQLDNHFGAVSRIMNRCSFSESMINKRFLDVCMEEQKKYSLTPGALSQLSIHERLFEDSKRRQEEKEFQLRKKEEKHSQDEKECIFHPQISNFAKCFGKKASLTFADRALRKTHELIQKTRQDIECSFKPQLCNRSRMLAEKRMTKNLRYDVKNYHEILFHDAKIRQRRKRSFEILKKTQLSHSILEAINSNFKE